jgi:exosome complex exonuclease DIS3/RRP44
MGTSIELCEQVLALTVQEMNKEAEIVNIRFTKSVIASKEAFTYEAAQLRKDDSLVCGYQAHETCQLTCFSSLKDPLTESIRLLNTLAIKLREARMKAGALSLSSPEIKIHLSSSESAEPIDVEQKQLRETNSLVEEFMLLANVSVARKIQESFPATAVLRYVCLFPFGSCL